MRAEAATLLHERASAVIPAGTHSNSRIRSGGPLYVERASGAWLWDVDGRRWLDCTMGNGAVILGHGDERVAAAVASAAEAGLTTGYEAPAAIEAIEQLAQIVPGFGRARFANSGTEALMHALAIARAATGRDGVAKVEGAYHGWFDLLFVSTWPPLAEAGPLERPLPTPGGAGLSRHAAETVVIPFNDADAAEQVLREHAGQLAALVLEPAMIDIGFIPGEPDYLERLRAVTAELGIVLIFDELLTGFRIAPGGAREAYGVHPDLTTFGKALANGVPTAVLEGKAELMDLANPLAGGAVPYVGTYNGHAVGAAATSATLAALADGAVQRQLQAMTQLLHDGFAALSARHGVPVTLGACGGHFQPYFVDGPVRTYRDAAGTDAKAYAVLRSTLEDRGILLAEKPLLHCALSAAHGPDEIDVILEAADEAFARIAIDR
jgi:glutamate-1-semialdehyde 2,1-aminomutase